MDDQTTPVADDVATDDTTVAEPAIEEDVDAEAPVKEDSEDESDDSDEDEEEETPATE